MSSTAQDQMHDRLVNELAYKYSGVFSRQSIQTAARLPGLSRETVRGLVRHRPAGQPLATVSEVRDDIQTRVSTLLRELGI